MLNRARHAAAVILVALAWTALARAAQPPAEWPVRKVGEDFTVDTPHYFIRTDISSELAQKAAGQQEALFDDLMKRMGGAKPIVMGKATVLITATRERYAREAGDTEGVSDGKFFPSKSLLVACGEKGRHRRVLEILRHEGSHQLITVHMGSTTPTWLNEGLAEFYEQGCFDAGRLQVGQVPLRRLTDLKAVIDGKRLEPFPVMLNMDSRTWLSKMKTAKDDTSSGLYEQAWGMVYFLAYADDGKYRPAFQQYIQMVAAGGVGLQPWEKVFGRDYMGFETRWRAYFSDVVPNSGDCEWNLRKLGDLLWQWRDRKPAFADLLSFRRAVFDMKPGPDETAITGLEMYQMCFRCPHEKNPGAKPSYEWVPGTDQSPPILRCRHHKGGVFETIYQKDAKGEAKVIVKSRPAWSVK
jgi:hypothetical protein